MSDLYLELKSMIPVVASRTEIGRARLEAAQSAAGLSNERLARLIPVSEKTWRRWKEAGTVPTYALPRVAQALRLGLVEAPRDGGLLPEVPTELRDLLTELASDVARLLDTQGEVLVRLAKIEATLDERPARRRAPAAQTRT